MKAQAPEKDSKMKWEWQHHMKAPHQLCDIISLERICLHLIVAKKKNRNYIAFGNILKLTSAPKGLECEKENTMLHS